MVKQTIRINQQTEVELIKTTNRTEIILTYDHEDPDAGQEIAAYGSDAKTTFSMLAHDWAEEVGEFIEGDKTYERVYEDYTFNMLDEIMDAMNYLQNFSFAIKNKEGNLVQVITIHEAAKIIRDYYIEENPCTRVKKVFNFKVGNIHGTTIDLLDSGELDAYEHWYKVKKISTSDLFDGGDGFIVAAGCYGGGDVGVAYCDREYQDDIEIAKKIEKAMCDASLSERDDLILLEIEEVV